MALFRRGAEKFSQRPNFLKAYGGSEITPSKCEHKHASAVYPRHQQKNLKPSGPWANEVSTLCPPIYIASPTWAPVLVASQAVGGSRIANRRASVEVTQEDVRHRSGRRVTPNPQAILLSLDRAAMSARVRYEAICKGRPPDPGLPARGLYHDPTANRRRGSGFESSFGQQASPPGGEALPSARNSLPQASTRFEIQLTAELQLPLTLCQKRWEAEGSEGHNLHDHSA